MQCVDALETSTRLSSKDLRVTYCLSSQKKRARSLYGLGGWGPSRRWGVHSPSIRVLERGLLERVLLQQNNGVWTTPLRPQSGVVFRELRPFWLLMRKKLVSLTPIAIDDFSGLYTGQKRAAYDRACESLKVRALNHKDARIKTFVKAEKLDLDSKPDPAPRVIQPRDTRFNLVFGTYIRPLEHTVYGILNNLCGGRTVAKGTTVEDVGEMMAEKWSSFTQPCFIGIDQSRFSQCVSVEARKFVQLLYKQAYPGDSVLRWCCLQTLRNRGAARCWDGHLKYVVDGTLSDGDMDTSLVANVLSVAMLLCWVKKQGIRKYRFIVNGDDCGVFVERCMIKRFISGLSEWYLTLGFKAKIELPVFELEHVEFCQSHPIFDGKRYVMVRRFPSAISKQCRSLVCLKSKLDYDAYWSCVGEGGLSVTGGIPVYQDFFRSLVLKPASRFFVGAVEGVWSPHLLCGRMYQPISPLCRVSFYSAFGYTPDEQCAIESYYRKTLYGFSHPVPVDNIEPRYPSLI